MGYYTTTINGAKAHVFDTKDLHHCEVRLTSSSSLYPLSGMTYGKDGNKANPNDDIDKTEYREASASRPGFRNRRLGPLRLSLRLVGNDSRSRSRAEDGTARHLSISRFHDRSLQSPAIPYTLPVGRSSQW